MTEITFLVKGSNPSPYEVKFTKSGNNLTALCTCPAGSFDMQCKHRVRILTGSIESIVSENEKDVGVILDWVRGTDVEAALANLVAL